MFFFNGSVAAGSNDDQYVCGDTYLFFVNEVTYLIKFVNANPGLPCTSGTATLTWQDKKETSPFTINSHYIIEAANWGKLVLDGEHLVYLDSATIIFDVY